MRPTFAGFSVAKRGLDAARAHLSITGQNMTNAETPGYTRQRVDVNSIGAMGWKTRYAASAGGYIGEGVNIGGISQLRDPYLDVRYRRESCKFGNVDVQLGTMKDLEYIFDEISKDGIDKQFSDLTTQLTKLAAGTDKDPVSESIVKTSAAMLLKMFNQCATGISNTKAEQLETLQDGVVSQINELTKGIADINKEIKQAQVAGNPALELRDSRNSMIDMLSGLMNIEVTSKNVDIGAGVMVEEVSVNLIGASNEKFSLVEHDKFSSIELTKTNDGDVEFPVKVIIKGNDGLPMGGSKNGVVSLEQGDITSELFQGEIAGHLKMLNSAGEFDEPPTKERGIQYYEKMLNTVAKEFATKFNEINSTSTPPIYDKPMFASSDGGEITAANICISDKWNNTIGNYLTTSKPGTEENILAMVDLMKKSIEYKTPIVVGTPPNPDTGGVPLFKGNFQQGFTNLSLTLALEMKDGVRQYENFGGVLGAIDEQRASVSSVNVDEEGINLIQYNQALQASSRFMTTLDEAVDVIINKMGLVGR